MTTAVRSVLTPEQRRALALTDVVCGTPEGYRLHRHQHSVPCGSCAGAWAVSPGCAPVTRPFCGSNRGWTAHRKQQEWPCRPCAEAREAYELTRCGSLAGWNIHRRNGTVVCERCAKAVRQYNASLRGCVVGKRARLSPEALRINPATVTGRLRRATLAGVRLVCTQEPYVGRAAVYDPRSRNDKYPWRVCQDPPHYVTAAFIAVVHPATESE